MLSAILTALPALISLVTAIVSLYKSAQEKGAGYDQAVKETVLKVLDDVQKANAAIVAAEKDHATHADDTAFDPDFRRD